MNRFAALTAATAIILSRSAQRANDIAPAYVSPVAYSTCCCPQISEEAARLSAHAAQAAGVQNSKATGDAVATGVGAVLFWPAPFFIKGNSTTAAEVASLKGQMQAVEEASIQKKCDITFRATPPA